MAAIIPNTDPRTGVESASELLQLPKNILTEISKYSITSPQDIVNLSFVCRIIKELVDQDQMWKWLADQKAYNVEEKPPNYKMAFQIKYSEIQIREQYIKNEREPNKKAQMQIDLMKVHPSKEIIETTEALIKEITSSSEQTEKMVEFEFAKPGVETLDKIALHIKQSSSPHSDWRRTSILKLIKKYCEIGQLDKALDFFNNLGPNSLSHEVYEKIQFMFIDKYCEKNNNYKALVILDRMSNDLDWENSGDDSLALNIASKYFDLEKKEKAIDLLSKIHIIEYGTALDSFFKLLEKYCNKDDLQIVKILLVKLPSSAFRRDDNLAKLIEKYSRREKSDIVNILLNNISSSKEKNICLLGVLKHYINLDKIDDKIEALIDQILEDSNWQKDSLLMVIDKYCELKKFDKALSIFTKRSKYSKCSRDLFDLINNYYSSITPELTKAILDKIPSDDYNKIYSLKNIIEKCCELGKLDIAEILYDQSADSHVKKASYLILLNNYCEENYLEKVQEYLAKITVDSYWGKMSAFTSDNKGPNILDRACKKKNFDLLKILIEQPFPTYEFYKNEPLVFLLEKYSKKGAFDVVKVLYDQISSFNRDESINKTITENIKSGDLNSLDLAKELFDLYSPDYIHKKIELQANLIKKYIEIGDLNSLDKAIELFFQIPIGDNSFWIGDKAKISFKCLVKYLDVVSKKDSLEKAGDLLAQIPSNLYFYDGSPSYDNECALFNKLQKLGNDENSQYILDAFLPKISQSDEKKSLIINLINQYCEKNLNEKAKALIPQLNEWVYSDPSKIHILPNLSIKAKSLMPRLPSPDPVAEGCNII